LLADEDKKIVQAYGVGARRVSWGANIRDASGDVSDRTEGKIKKIWPAVKARSMRRRFWRR